MAELTIKVDCCIYCGSRGELTDEHVIPLGLGGNLVLPASSCKQCATLTSKFELFVLRGFMREARAVAGLPSRRKAQQPKTIKHELTLRSGDALVRELPISASLAFLHLPVFSPCRFLDGKPPIAGLQIRGLDTLHFGKDVESFVLEQGATAIRGNVRIDVNAFARMLAKIAYGFHVGADGQFPSEESPALALLKAQIQQPGSWIGSIFAPTPESTFRGLHALSLEHRESQTGDQLSVVHVKLFARTGACTYEVVTRCANWRSFR